MGTPTKTALDNALRDKNVNALIGILGGNGEEVLRVGGNVIAFPTTDSAGNDAWVEITVKIPKGERLGKGEGFAGYDGYNLAEFYKEQTDAKATEAAEKKKKADEKAAAAEAKKNKVKTEDVTPIGDGE